MSVRGSIRTGYLTSGALSELRIRNHKSTQRRNIGPEDGILDNANHWSSNFQDVDRTWGDDMQWAGSLKQQNDDPLIAVIFLSEVDG